MTSDHPSVCWMLYLDLGVQIETLVKLHYRKQSKFKREGKKVFLPLFAQFCFGVLQGDQRLMSYSKYTDHTEKR